MHRWNHSGNPNAYHPHPGTANILATGLQWAYIGNEKSRPAHAQSISGQGKHSTYTPALLFPLMRSVAFAALADAAAAAAAVALRAHCNCNEQTN